MRTALRPAAKSRLRLLAGLISALGLWSATAQAQYPERPITLIVPFAAGGPTDKTARDLAEALRKPLAGATIVIENLGGAGGTIGAAKVAHAPPDGYTLLLHHIGMATAPSLYRRLPYKTLEDFEYLGLLQEVPMTLIGRSNLAAGSYADLAKFWAANPATPVTLGHSGVGSASHLCGLMLMSAAKHTLNTIPYKGTGPAMIDLLGGQIDLMCDQTTNTTEQITAGRVKAFAVTTAKRLATPGLSALPTLNEAGLKGFQLTVWVGLYAPKGMPAPLVQRLNQALRAVLKDPEFIARQQAMGAVVIDDDRASSEGHRKYVAAEIGKWEPLIRAAGAQVD